MTVVSRASERRFYPQMEGMRAVAAVGVLTTHVAFQTGAVGWPVVGPVLGRLDLAVALFFALSGFLLWQPHALAAWALAPEPGLIRYVRHRFWRIWPAYTVVVVVVLLLLPEARTSDPVVWLANLTLTQVFVPLSLTAGLTQMWSLSVEVLFYALLPVLAWSLVSLRGDRARWRVVGVLGFGVVGLLWGPIAAHIPAPDGVEAQNWLIGHLPWFVAGLLLAELTVWRRAVGSGSGDVGAGSGASVVPLPAPLVALCRWSENRPLMLAVFVLAYGLACTPLAGPVGMGELSALGFATKILLGAIGAFAILAPLALGDGPFRFLASSVMTTLGRWSYGIFIWHVAVLSVVFGLFGIIPFSGSFVLVWVITVVLSVGIAAASYAFVEDPVRRWAVGRSGSTLNPVEERHSEGGIPPAVARSTGFGGESSATS
ncbi:MULTISPECIES: acyltransferase family protein [unclassified Gordonia (in: high G+C Gram-positive bacteria)]|uniref:acyltransferase family protein n=2 Tax=Gordonia TaxID=2053 RepID=UPI000FBB11CE|nr:MAG: acyltransferase [Gordonia sp. (in: high G+C Gram-positive bacteria)]